PAGRPPRQGGRQGQQPLHQKDQQSKAVRVKCRINGELCCGRRRSFPAVHSLHPAAAWTWARAVVCPAACVWILPVFTALLCAVCRMGEGRFCVLPHLDSEKEALP